MPLHHARMAMLDFGIPSKMLIGYLRQENLDIDSINGFAGCYTVVPARFHRLRDVSLSDIVPDGEPSFIIEVLAADGEEVIDLVAWSLQDPRRFGKALPADQGADMLGISDMTNPATFAGGGALRVWRTPLAWARAGCRGCVPLNRRWAGYWLSRVEGRLMVEDFRHGQEIIALVPPGFDRGRLLVPVERAA
jgi:hypothetical protein